MGSSDCIIIPTNELYSEGLARCTPTRHRLRQREVGEEERDARQDRPLLCLRTAGVRLPRQQ